MTSSNYLLKKIFKSSEALKKSPHFMFESSSINIFLNNFSYLQLKENNIDFNNFDNIFCDGALLASLASNKIGEKISRVSFDETSLAFEWLNFGIQESMNVLIIGATQKENDKFIDQIKQSLNISEENIKGLNGYDLDINDISLDDAGSYLIIIGLGSPLQEKFALSLQQKYKNSEKKLIFFTCGGFISQTSRSQNANLSYYPRIVNLLNIRWLYRFFKEEHTFVRTVFNYPRSIIKFILNEYY